MNVLDIIFIGLALSMDACALTISNCAVYKNSLNKKNELSMPVAFAFFQGIMPLLGYYIGSLFSETIGNFAGYLSAIIFFVLALKIVVDIYKDNHCQITEQKEQKNTAKLTLLVLLVQAVSTSIDALAIGVTFINLQFSVYIAVIIISLVTFALVSLALLLGKKLGDLFGQYAEWLGAIILFILSIKSLIEAIFG